MQQVEESIRRRWQPGSVQDAGAGNDVESDLLMDNNQYLVNDEKLQRDNTSHIASSKSTEKIRSNASETVILFNNDKFNDSLQGISQISKTVGDTRTYDATASTRNVHGYAKGIPESALEICIQTIFPFFMAGLGMVAAGVLLDKVQHWKVFQNVSEIFILVPALLGLKGNLEMTLASRLSTYANQGLLNDRNKCWKIVWGNMVTVEAQSMVVAFVASLLAQTLGWISNGRWEAEHAVILCAGGFLTGAIASGVLGVVMILVVLLSRKLAVNPDNVATPIAAALGDLITLSLLSNITQWLYSIAYTPNFWWVGSSIIVLFFLLTPLLIWLSYCNEFTKDVIQHGWIPVLSAMAISSSGGFVLNSAVLKYPGIAVYSPVVNGVGGNLVAIQASRTSTSLHTSGCPMGSLLGSQVAHSSPWKTFSSSNPHSVGAKVMLFMVFPGQIVFLFAITAMQAGHTAITPSFVAIYLLISFIQVAALLHVCNWLVFYLWKIGSDPDNSSIPYLTSLGDLLGTGLLACAFSLLFWIGDRSVKMGL